MIRIATVALSLVLAASSPVLADEPKQGSEKRPAIAERVDRHLQRGIEFYAEKQYELAIIEFRAGFALDPRPALMFALAQAERLSGDCPSAIVYYERFLETDPDENQAEAARVNRRRCTRALESSPQGKTIDDTPDALDDAEEASDPAPSVTPPPSRDADSTSDGPPWYQDVVGGSLLGGGVVALGVGALYWNSKADAEDDARNAGSYVEYVDAVGRARGHRTISLVSASVGAALVTGAVIRYVTLDDGAGERDSKLVATPTRGGAVVGLTGSF